MKDTTTQFVYKDFGLEKPGDLTNLFRKYPNRIFIETGTALGGTLFDLLDSNFATIKSVELLETRQAVNRLAIEWLSRHATGTFSMFKKVQILLAFIKQCLKGILRGELRELRSFLSVLKSVAKRHLHLGNTPLPKVELYEGMSYKMLPTMLEGVKEAAVIFLDAHPSGKGSGGHKELSEGKKEYSLSHTVSEELKVILQHEIKDHVIVIDDVNKAYGDSQVIPLFEKAGLLDRYHFFHSREIAAALGGREEKLLFCIPVHPAV